LIKVSDIHDISLYVFIIRIWILRPKVNPTSLKP
jgi:hypothetical protein